MRTDAKLSKQLDDFPISFAIKARVIFERTGQSALRKVHGARGIGASLNQSPDDPLVPMHDRANQRRRTVVLFPAFNVSSVVQKPLQPFRFVVVDATVKQRGDEIHRIDLIGIGLSYGVPADAFALDS